MQLLKQSSTAKALVFFLYSSTDHVSGLTGASPTVKLGKNGGTGASPSGTVTEIDSTNLPGFYKVAGNATDTNTLGALVLSATASGADQATMAFCVVAFDPDVASNLGLSALPTTAAGASGGLPLGVDSSGRVDVLKINGTSQTARDIGASVLLSSGTGTGQLSITSGIAAVNTTQFAGSAVVATTGKLWCLDGSGNAIAPAATALSTAVWTGVPTGFLAATFPSGTIANTTNITAGTITTTTNLTNAPTAGDFTSTMKTSITSAVPTAAANAAATRDVNNTSPAASSLGAAVNSAASAGDPWATNLPGAYSAGTAGYILGTNLDAAISGVPAANDNADALLKRDWTSVSGEAAYSLLNAARFLRCKWAFSGSTLTVYKEDGTTSAWTKTATLDPTAEPITGLA